MLRINQHYDHEDRGVEYMEDLEELFPERELKIQWNHEKRIYWNWKNCTEQTMKTELIPWKLHGDYQKSNHF